MAVWTAAFRTPPANRLLIPDTLIAADSPAGKQLLTENGFLSDYDALTKAFEAQSRPGFCGVASTVVVLNALAGATGHLTQSTFFTDRASKIRTSLQITFRGMTLEQLGALLQAHGANVAVHYASDTSLDAFRAIAQQNLATPGDFMLVNYERAALSQGKIGHISPLAAYNEKTDRLLILDVATHKYPWVWVSTEALWTAMNTVDSDSGRSRGFAVVSRTSRRRRR
jgi:hypothetical protein